MHRALKIQEILLLIFRYCPSLAGRPLIDLCSLARTCRTFKEPALDLIWEELENVAPLAWCLPQVCRAVGYYEYIFIRPLTLIEWDTLRSYTRRIRFIFDFTAGLHPSSLTILSNPPTTEPLFPNLRSLGISCRDGYTHLLHLPFPSLTYLRIISGNLDLIQDLLKSFPELSPNIRDLSVYVDQSDVAFSELVAGSIRRWRDLRSVSCPQVAMDVATLTHLSRTPALTFLDFTLRATLAYIDSPLSFSTLREIVIHSESLQPISQLLSRTKLPVITHFTAVINGCPSKQQLSMFWVSLQTSSTDHFIKTLALDQYFSWNIVVRSGVLLNMEDLRPCMAFRNLRQLRINLAWSVCLTDSQLLQLASAWPHLKELCINSSQGWNTLGGITPHGLSQLLQTCRSLCHVSLVIDTRGYTEPPEKGLLTSVGFTPSYLSLDVLDSVIDEASVPAMGAFLRSTRSSRVYIYARMDMSLPDPGVYVDRWDQVHELANAAVEVDRGGSWIARFSCGLASCLTKPL